MLHHEADEDMKDPRARRGRTACSGEDERLEALLKNKLLPRTSMRLRPAFWR